jgi:hypothetical protein
MLRSLPVENPSQLVLLQWSARNAPNIHGYQSAGDCLNDLRFGAKNPSGCSFSEPMFREIAQSNVFSATAAFANSGRLNLTGNGPATVINGQLVSGGFFRTMGLKPAVGRLLETADDTLSAAPVAVLNYGYWQSALGGARDVIGRTIELNNVPFTIVGVAEQRFTGITPGSDYHVWLPLSNAQRITDPMRWQDKQGDVSIWWLTIIGRLRVRSQLAQAQAAVSGLFRNEMLHGSVPLFHGGEMAGVPGSRAVGSAKVRPGPAPAAGGNDLRVLGFTVAVSLLTGILFGIAPTLRSARVDLTPALKEGERSFASSGRAAGKWFSIGNALVVAQVALAIVVLVGAGLLVRTLQNLRSIDVGFDSHNILIFGIDATQIGYKGPQVDNFYRDLQGRLAETPGVKSASYSMVPLLSNGLMVTMFHWPDTPQDQNSESDMLGVGPNFFETLHIPFLAGRGFNASDFKVSASNDGTAPTLAPTPVIVNQAFVEKYLGKENPLGKQFGQAEADTNHPRSPGYEIIGVVRDTKYNNLRREIHAMMYMPQSAGGASFELRTAADPRAILPAIREVVAQVNTNLPLFDVKTESEQIDQLLFQERLVARLSGFFGLLALVLACVGLYGLLSYEVSRRTREIGIRMALGAHPGRVLKLVLRQGIVLAIVGAAAGIGVALGVTRYLTSMLYDVHANDPLTMIAVAVLLTIVALAACYIPARRAMRVDPMVALRYE